MTMTTETRPEPIAIGPIFGFGRRLLTALHRRRLRRHTQIVLQSLDDHMLRDIGLRRDQIGWVFRA